MKSKFLTLFSLLGLFALSGCSLTKPNRPHFDNGTSNNDNENENDNENDNENENNNDDNDDDDNNGENDNISHLTVNEFLNIAAFNLNNELNSFTASSSFNRNHDGNYSSSTLKTTYNKDTEELFYLSNFDDGNSSSVKGYVKSIDNHKSLKITSTYENGTVSDSYKYVESNYPYFFKNQIINLAMNPSDYAYYSFPTNLYDLVRGCYFISNTDAEIEEAIETNKIRYLYSHPETNSTKIDLQIVNSEASNRKKVSFYFRDFDLYRYENETYKLNSSDEDVFSIDFDYTFDRSLLSHRNLFNEDKLIMIEEFRPKILISCLNNELSDRKVFVYKENFLMNTYLENYPTGEIQIHFYKDMFKRQRFDPNVDTFARKEVKAIYYDVEVLNPNNNCILETYIQGENEFTKWAINPKDSLYKKDDINPNSNYYYSSMYGSIPFTTIFSGVKLPNTLNYVRINVNCKFDNTTISDANNFLSSFEKHFLEDKNFYFEGANDYNGTKSNHYEVYKVDNETKNHEVFVTEIDGSNRVDKYVDIIGASAVEYLRKPYGNSYKYFKVKGQRIEYTDRPNYLVNMGLGGKITLNLVSDTLDKFIKFDNSLGITNKEVVEVLYYEDSYLYVEQNISNNFDNGRVVLSISRVKDTFKINLNYALGSTNINSDLKFKMYDESYDAINFYSLLNQNYN